MNAVVKSVPAPTGVAALRAYRERMRAIEREVAPLRGRKQALLSNISAAEEALAAAIAEMGRMREVALPDYVAIGAKREEADLLRERVQRLREAAASIERDIGRIESRVRQEPVPLLALEHAALRDLMGEACDRRREAVQALAALEEEVEAYVRAGDQIAVAYEAQHRGLAPGMSLLAISLQSLRESEHKSLRHLIHGQIPERIQARAAEIRREIEAL